MPPAPDAGRDTMDDIRPNRLSTPEDRGKRDARARVEAVFVAVDRLPGEVLAGAPVPDLDHDDREWRLEALEARAVEADRDGLLDEARDAIRDSLLRRFSDRRIAVYGTSAVGIARVQDQAAIVTVLRDLVAVAATRDLISDEDAAALAAPGLRVLDEASLEDLLEVASAVVADESGAGERGAPTAEEWAEAESGETAIARRGAERRPRDPRAMVLLALTAGSVLAVVAMRMDRSAIVVGALLGGAAILVVWALFAWRRR